MRKALNWIRHRPLQSLVVFWGPAVMFFSPATTWADAPGVLAVAGAPIAIMLWLSLSPKAWSKQLDSDISNGVAFVGGLFTFVAVLTWVYGTMSANAPKSFNEPLTRIDAFYFTLATFTTTGFGDVHPVSQGARLIVALQMALGLLVVTVGITRALSHARSEGGTTRRE